MPCIKVSAPGSIMLTGEHAVLHGYMAAACAVNKRISLTLRTTDARRLRIKSQIGSLDVQMDALPAESGFNFIVEAIRQSGIECGLEIETESEFSHKVGLGSSAAVTVCICAALNYALGTEKSPAELFTQCYQVVHGVQRTGSGSDLAASVFGGIVAMQRRGGEFIPKKISCPAQIPLDLFYCGYKTKTPDVIAIVNRKAQSESGRYKELYSRMGSVAVRTIDAIEVGNLALVGRLFDEYQLLMEELGVCDSATSDILRQLRSAGGIYGAKISGSGLGDCVVSLGIPNTKPSGYLNIPISMSAEGVVRC